MPSSDRENDEVVDQYLAVHRAEALAWLKDKCHDMVRESKSEHVAFVQAFYEAGAKEVLVSDFTKPDAEGVRYAKTLVVVLPDDKKRRQQVLQRGADLLWDGKKQPPEKMKAFGFVDQGQKYIEWGVL